MYLKIAVEEVFRVVDTTMFHLNLGGNIVNITLGNLIIGGAFFIVLFKFVFKIFR